MMIRVPGVTDNGIVTNKLVEFVDLFPTLTEAAGLGSLDLCPENSSLISVCTEAHSLLPLMRDPDSASWKTRVFSQYPRNHMKVMSYSMRTESQSGWDSRGHQTSSLSGMTSGGLSCMNWK